MNEYEYIKSTFSYMLAFKILTGYFMYHKVTLCVFYTSTQATKSKLACKNIETEDCWSSK